MWIFGDFELFMWIYGYCELTFISIGFGGAAMKETANSSGVGGNGKNNTEIINSITVVNSVNANSSAHHLRHHQQAVAANLPDVASQVHIRQNA